MAKSSKSARTDRQKVVEQMRAEQKAAERRRGTDHRGGVRPGGRGHRGSRGVRPDHGLDPDLEVQRQAARPASGRPASVCQKVTTKPADGNQQHLPDGSPGRLHRRPARLRQALPHSRRDGPEVLHRPGPAGARHAGAQRGARLHDPLVRRHGRQGRHADGPDQGDRRTSSPAPPTCATSSRPCRGRRTTASPSPTVSTSPSPTGRSAAPQNAAAGSDKQVGRLAVLLERLRCGAPDLHGRLPVQRLPRARRDVAAPQVRSARPVSRSRSTIALTSCAWARVVTSRASGVSTTTTSSTPTSATRRPLPRHDEPGRGVGPDEVGVAEHPHVAGGVRRAPRTASGSRRCRPRRTHPARSRRGRRPRPARPRHGRWRSSAASARPPRAGPATRPGRAATRRSRDARAASRSSSTRGRTTNIPAFQR